MTRLGRVAIVFGLALILFGITAFTCEQFRAINNEFQDSAANATLYACTMAHKGAPSYSWQNCRASEEHTHTEYICTSDGSRCWVEKNN